MKVSKEKDVITVKGSIKGEAGTNLGKLLLKETSPVKLDLKGVSYIDTLAIGVLVTVSAKFKNKGLTLELQNCPPAVKNLLNLAKIQSLLRMV